MLRAVLGSGLNREAGPEWLWQPVSNTGVGADGIHCVDLVLRGSKGL